MQSKRITRPCQTCGAPFAPYPSEIRKGGGKFCRRSCYYSSQPIHLVERFWSKVDKNGPTPPHRPDLGPCWLWTARLDEHGRGVLGAGGGGATKLRAARVSWEIHHGPIPKGLRALHRCDNPPCVRPNHLFLGTQADNMRDMVSKGRHAADIQSDCWQPKMTPLTVIEARAAYATGQVSIAALARAYHMTPAGMRRVLTRQTWAHL